MISIETFRFVLLFGNVNNDMSECYVMHFLFLFFMTISPPYCVKTTTNLKPPDLIQCCVRVVAQLNTRFAAD